MYTKRGVIIHMYNVVEISKYIINKCTKDNHPISNIQLQKILYSIQVQFIKDDRKAFDADFEAWLYGPVNPRTYYKYCIKNIQLIFGEYETLPEFVNSDQAIIDEIINEKRKLSNWEAIFDTYKTSQAWQRIYANGAGDHHIIPISYIRRYDCQQK